MAVLTQSAPQAVRPLGQSIEQRPMRHAAGVGQTLPQVPQLVVSLAVSVQTPLQTVKVAGHPTGTQAPAVQRWPDGHALPQVPQWALLVARSAQALPHIICEAGHISRHDPLSQTWPTAQRLPQAPQLRSSLAVSVHVRPEAAPPSMLTPASPATTSQRAYIGPHSWVHAPSEQTRPAAQERSHEPQLVRSVLRLTQRWPQRVWPVGQAPRQRPLTHIWSPAQAKPQVPQFIGSDPRSRQVLRHGESGASQVRPPMSVV